MNSDTIFQIVRYALVAVGGALASRGYITAADVESLAGGVIGLIGALWGLYVKSGTRAVPESVARRADVPTVSGATGAVQP